MNCVGIDGCHAGWLWIGLDNERAWQFGIGQHGSDLHEIILSSLLTLIDIPVGLVDSGNAGRKCDREARRLLRSRASSIFSPPARGVLKADSYDEGNRIHRSLTGHGLSRQSWGITAKIREIDQLLRMHPDIRCKIRESHPEMCFWCLNDKRPMSNNKKKAAGRKERITVLTRVYPMAEVLIKEIADKYLRRKVAWDDIHDALACALVARRGYGRLSAIPSTVQFDGCGLPMEIVYSD